MKEYFTESELIMLAASANSFEELKLIAERLRWLWALGEKIDMQLFDILSHKRLRQII